MATQDKHLCANCGNPDPVDLPFCGFCGHPKSPAGGIGQADQLASVLPDFDTSLELDHEPPVPAQPFPTQPVAPAPAAAPPPGAAVPAASTGSFTAPIGAPPTAGPSGRPELRVNRSRIALAAVVVVVLGIIGGVVALSGGSHPSKPGSHTGTTGASGKTSPTAAPSVLAGSAAAPWTEQVMPPDLTVGHLFDVSCPSTSDCVAVGANGSGAEILTTGDGGSTWTTQNYPQTPGLSSYGQLFSVSCGSTTVCQAVGGTTITILTTDDGGSSWVSDPYPPSLAGGHLFSVTCVTANICWALGGDANGTQVIVVTHDGGDNWTQQSYPSGLHLVDDGPGPISCPTVSHCTIAANDGGTLAIVTTQDGGATWTTQKYSSSISAKTNGTASDSCPTVDVCYITGFSTGAGGTGSPVIVATKDGGATWTTQSYPSSLQLKTLTAVRCASADNCWTVGTTAGGPVVLTTSDGGANWSSQSYPQGISDLIDLSCPHDPSTCWMVASGAASQPVVLGSKQPSS